MPSSSPERGGGDGDRSVLWSSAKGSARAYVDDRDCLGKFGGRREIRDWACYGMLYDNQISSVLWSPPNQGLTNLATPVLAPHPNKIMRVVNEGWQSSTTVRDRKDQHPDT